MPNSPAQRYTLEHEGHVHAAETVSEGWSTRARLFVDGQQVDEQPSKDHRVVLTGGGLTVVVRLNVIDQVTEILAVPAGTEPKLAEEIGMAFAPPPGSRAARLEALKRQHPVLYAARHLALAVGQLVVGSLGIGALLWALASGFLPATSVPLPDIPWPAIDLPSIPWPDIPWPAISLPDPVHDLLRRVGQVASSLKWLVPIAIALFAAINEVERRRKRARAEAERMAMANQRTRETAGTSAS